MRDKSRASVSSRIHSNIIGERLGKELLYLSHADVASAGLGMAEIITALEEHVS